MNLTNYAKPWTKEDIRYLTENYDPKRKDELSEYFGRTWAAIKYRANCIGVSGKKSKDWDEKEIKDLIDLYPKTSNRELEVIFGRSIKGITCKAYELGLIKQKEFKDKPKIRKSSRSWSEEEINLLHAHFPNMATNKLPINRTIGAITMMAKRLGIKKSPNHIRKCRYAYSKMKVQGVI